MSLASVIAGFRKRIQTLERGLGRVERRLGTELPPDWEAQKLAVNPLNLGYTPVVPLVFGGASGNATTCSRMKLVEGRLLADPDDTTAYGFQLFDTGSPRFTPFPGAIGWGIPDTGDVDPGFLVIWHQGMGMPVWLTGLVGKMWADSSHVSGRWWAFKWVREGAGVGWDEPLTWQSPGCSAVMLLNSEALSDDIYFTLLTPEADWSSTAWMLVQMFHTANGFFFETHVAPTFGTRCLSGQIPSYEWYPVMAEEEGA